MAGVFKRSLFKAPVYEHYGTGIASGLDDRPGYAAGGRIGYAAGSPDPEEDSINIQELIAEGATEKGKNALLDGDWVMGKNIGKWDKFSPLALDFHLQLRSLIEAQGLTGEVWKGLDFNTKSLIAQQLSDDIIADLSKKYNISEEQIQVAFGGELKDGSNYSINNTIKSIDTHTRERQKGFTWEDLETQMQGQLESGIEGITEKYPTALDPLPSVVAAEQAETQAEQEAARIAAEKKAAEQAALEAQRVAQQGIFSHLDRTSPKFRTQYVDYLKDLQGETELNEKRKRQAIESGFMNLGAADPVQPWEGMGRAMFKSFQEPMAALREQEALQAEDIYKRGADIVDESLAPPESREVQLMNKLIEMKMSPQAAMDIVSGASAQSSAELRTILSDDTVMEQISTLMQPIESGGQALTFEEAMEAVLGPGFSLTQPGITAQGPITSGGVAGDLGGMNTIESKDGGRVGMQGGGATEVAQTAQAATPTAPGAMAGVSSVAGPMSYEELREKLPDYISDDVVRLLSENPQALVDLAQARTDRDLRLFEQKYDVQVTMPLADEEEFTNEMV